MKVATARYTFGRGLDNQYSIKKIKLQKYPPNRTFIKDDNKAPSNIKSVNISPCSDNPCIFHHNTTVKVEVTFTAQMNSSSLKAQIYGIVAGIPVSFPMPNPDGCNKSGIACPISQGSEYTYQSVFNVIPSYPD
ncbi:hypothetical protein KUTeg_013749, partial [Tegillarca granosa]